MICGAGVDDRSRAIDRVGGAPVSCIEQVPEAAPTIECAEMEKTPTMTLRIPNDEQLIVPADAQPIPWREGARRLAEASTFWLATAHLRGRPHVRPILAVLVDDALHFASGTSARKTSHLAGNPNCTVSTSTSDLDLVAEGTVARVVDEARLQRVADAYLARYGWPVTIRDGAFFADGAPTAGPPPFHVYELQPSTIYGFGTDDALGSRSTAWRY